MRRDNIPSPHANSTIIPRRASFSTSPIVTGLGPMQKKSRRDEIKNSTPTGAQGSQGVGESRV
jgi:hypothetical protein